MQASTDEPYNAGALSNSLLKFAPSQIDTKGDSHPNMHQSRL